MCNVIIPFYPIFIKYPTNQHCFPPLWLQFCQRRRLPTSVKCLGSSGKSSNNKAAATASVAHSNNKARKAIRATTNCLSELD